MKLFIAGFIFLVLIGGAVAWERYEGAWVAVKKPNADVVSSVGNTNATSTTTATPKLTNGPFTLPQGFAVSIFASKLGNPRVLTFDPSGALLASLTKQGKVVALPDKNKDGMADSTVTVLSGLRTPHGLALRCQGGSVCTLYVAEVHQLTQYEYAPTSSRATKKRKLLSLPTGGRHTTRTLQLTKENGRDILLISIGSSCDTCRESDARRGSVISYDIASGKSAPYAKGLRNAVFMTEQPGTGKIFVTEMGRDNLGDNLPPDEINVLEKDKNYGWPICYGKNIHDTVFDKNTYIRNPCLEPFETESFIDIPAHSAPLGLGFVTSETWPDDFRGDLLVALHGSWNRSTPNGYSVVRMKFDEGGNYTGTEDFMTGFVKGSKRYGRPAGVVFGPDGNAYVSDDSAGVIYKIEYRS